MRRGKPRWPTCWRKRSRCCWSWLTCRRTRRRKTSNCCGGGSRSAARWSSCAWLKSNSANGKHFEETMKKLYLLWLILIVAAPLAARASYAGATGAEMAMSDAQENGGDAEVDLYSQGTEAVDDEEWTHAIDIFKRVAAMKGKRADAALYWLAYAQEKAGRGAEAVQTITALERTSPSSRW